MSLFEKQQLLKRKLGIDQRCRLKTSIKSVFKAMTQAYMLVSLVKQMHKAKSLSKSLNIKNPSPWVHFLSNASKFTNRKSKNNGKTKNYCAAKSKKNRKKKKIIQVVHFSQNPIPKKKQKRRLTRELYTTTAIEKIIFRETTQSCEKKIQQQSISCFGNLNVSNCNLRDFAAYLLKFWFSPVPGKQA